MSSWLLLIVLAILGAGIYWGFQSLRPKTTGTASPSVIMIRRGMSPSEITQVLDGLGIIKDPKAFFWTGKMLGQWKRIKAGEYEVSPQQSPREIFEILSSGQSIRYPVTVPEGWNLYEIAHLLEQKGFGEKTQVLSLARDPARVRKLLKIENSEAPPISLEGYLFPDTYHFTRLMSVEEILAAMTSRFWKEWAQEWDTRAQSLGWNRHQVVTLASMIEKETGAPEERPLIGSVFHNRLSKRMRLQSDPTTIYGIWESYDGNIRKKDLLTPSPYNTYTLPGLPIGPIANPGREALKAALYPAQSDYLYFVSKNEGRHEFTTRYEDHVRAVREFQLNAKARQGKSWRDLSRSRR